MNSLVISIHDVSPRTRPAVERMLDLLKGAPVSLLVIPNHHRLGHFLNDPSFCSWLREQVAAGHEAVMHGYYHQRPLRSGESFQDRLMTRIYTAGEGEFYDLAEEDALTLVRQAQREFAEAGLAPAGFIAPAWLLSDAAERALKRARVRYTVRLRSVTSLTDGRVWQSQSLVWSVRAGWRRLCSLLWNETLYRRVARAELARVSLHPPDLDHPAIWKQALNLVARLQANHGATTYGRWVASNADAATSKQPTA